MVPSKNLPESIYSNEIKDNKGSQDIIETNKKYTSEKGGIDDKNILDNLNEKQIDSELIFRNQILNGSIRYPSENENQQSPKKVTTKKGKGIVNNNYEQKYNPWAIGNASAFLKYCCPECEFQEPNLQFFTNHSLEKHPLAVHLFPDRKYIEPSRSDLDIEIKKECKDCNLSLCVCAADPLQWSVEVDEKPLKIEAWTSPIFESKTKTEYVIDDSNSTNDKIQLLFYQSNTSTFEEIKKHKCEECEFSTSLEMKLEKHKFYTHFRVSQKE